MTRMFNPPSPHEYHLSEDTVTRMVCDELSPAESLISKQHLDLCLKCKERFERIQRTVLEIAERRQRIVEQMGQLVPARRDGFIEQLDNLLESTPSTPAQIPFPVQRGLEIFRKIEPLLATAAIATCMGLIFTSVWHSESTAASNANSLDGVAVSGQSSENITTSHDSADGQQRQSVVRDKNALFPRHAAPTGARRNDPHSAYSFNERHGRPIVSKNDIESSDPELRAMSAPIAGEPRNVGKDEFQPEEKNSEFRDSGPAEISLVTPNPLSFGKANQPVPLPAPEPSIPAAAPRVPVFVPLPTMTQINKTELDARLKLNQMSADTGEQIEIKRDEKGVYVQGLVESKERKKVLEDSLRPIPFLSVSIRSLDDVKSASALAAQASVTQRKSAVANISPFERYFLDSGRSREDLSRISAGLFNSSLAINQSSRSIEQVGQRFSADANLSPAAVHSRNELLLRIGNRLLADLEKQKLFLDQANLDYEIVPGGPEESPTHKFELTRLAGMNMTAATELVSGPGKSPGSQKALANELARTILQLRTTVLTIIPSLSSK